MFEREFRMCVCVCGRKRSICLCICASVPAFEEVVFACLDDSVFITVSSLCECGKEYGVCLKNSSGYDCFIA